MSKNKIINYDFKINERKLSILFYGPFPTKDNVGGYARINSNITNSDLTKKFKFIKLNVHTFQTLKYNNIKKIFYPLIYVICAFIDTGNVFYKINTLKIKKNHALLHITSLYKWHIFREIIIIILAKLYKIPVIFDIRAGNFVNYYYDYSIVYKKIIGYSLKMTSKVLVEGRDYIDFLNNTFEVKAEYFPNFITKEYLKYKNIARSLGEKKEFIVVYSGSITKEKGIEDLIDAFSLIQNNGNIQLLLIGPYKDDYNIILKKKYSQILGRKISLLGKMSIDEIFKIYANADIFVFPSFHIGEGHSNAINEAMLAGLPIIYYDNGFLKDVIGEAGICIKKHDVKSLSDAIFKLMENEDLRKKYSEAAVNNIMSKYTEEKVLAKLSNIYLGILERS